MVPERRLFFRRMFGFALNSEETTSRPLSVHPGLSPGSGQAESWIPLGTLAQFPPGTATPINGGRQVLHSLPDGLRAIDAPCLESESIEPIRPLKLERGVLALNPSGAWPQGSILSFITGTLSHAQEERS